MLRKVPIILWAQFNLPPGHLSGHHGAEGDDAPSSDGGVTQQQRPQDGGGDIWQIQQIHIPSILFILLGKEKMVEI